MILERIKQKHKGISRRWGVHGTMLLKSKKLGEALIYTLESPWNINKDEPNGIVGLSCIAPGSYDVHLETSPIDQKLYPFVVNESKNVCLRTRNNIIDRTGHAFYPADELNPLDNYGRYILCGTGYDFKSGGYYMPNRGRDAIAIINEYIKETGDKTLKIEWID